MDPTNPPEPGLQPPDPGPEEPVWQAPSPEEPAAETWLPPVVAAPKPPPPEGGEPTSPLEAVPAKAEPRWPMLLMLGSFVVLAASLAFWWTSRSPSDGQAPFAPTAVPTGTAPVVIPTGAPTATPTPSSVGTGYAFLATAPDGSPYRWNPCAPILYVVNTANAPAGALADVQEAARRLSLAAGMEFRFAGTTAESPEQRRAAGYVVQGGQGPAWAPVLIAWASGAEFQALGYDPAASGAGGPFPGEPDVAQTGRYVSGLIVLNAGIVPTPPDGFATPTSWGIVVMHELGHVVGLDHVEDPNEIMSAGLTQPRTVTDWGPGDRAGLALVGRQAGCLPEVVPPAA